MDCDFGEFLDRVEGSTCIYCVECYSKAELLSCLDTLSEHGWPCHAGIYSFEDDDVECVTIWLYGESKKTEWNKTTYKGYAAWYEQYHGEPDDEVIDGVYHFSVFSAPVIEAVDTQDFDDFLSSL